MSFSHKILANISLWTALLWVGAGCGGNNGATLTVTPGGPVVVQRAATQQFTANRNDVQWSVPGGNSNGTVNGAGLYTAPATLPTTSPQVSVQAVSTDGQVATALISLRAADTIEFGSAVKSNSTPISNYNFIFEVGAGGLLSDRMSVRLGSVQQDSAFSDSFDPDPPPTPTPEPTPNVFFTQSLNFGPWSAPDNLNNDDNATYGAGPIETDSNLNPGLLVGIGDPSEFRLFFMGSTNGGTSFNPPVPISPAAPPTNSQVFGTMRIDDQDKLYVTYAEMQPTPSPEVSTIFHVQSDNGGVDWTSPVTIHSTTTGGNLFPSLAVDPTGTHVAVCWGLTEESSGDSRIVFSVSHDGGSTFSSPDPVSTGTAVAPFCRVSIGPSGNIYVSFGEDDNGDTDVDLFLRISSDEGAQFGPPKKVNSSAINAPFTFAMLSVDDLERIDLIWNADPNNSGDADTLYYARSLDGGATFSDNVVIASGPSGIPPAGTGIIPRALRHDRAGRVYVQYGLGDGSFFEDPLGTYDIFNLVGE